MGKRGHAIGMILCVMLAIASQIYSDGINGFFTIDVDKQNETGAPLVGLQMNESWLVVLVDFESNPIEDTTINTIGDELQEYSEEYFSQSVGGEISLSIDMYDK